MRKAKPAYPYLNTGLSDFCGEQWDDLPGLEGYFEISNLGRVKRLYRETLCVDGKVMRFQEKMMRPFPDRQYNKTVKEYNYFLSARVQVEGRNFKISIGRMVYYLFKEKFDLADERLVVYARDGDGKNIKPSNLRLVDIKGRAKRIYERGRLKREILTTWEEYKYTAKQKSENKACRQVSQFNKKGKYLKTFPSIRVASGVTGVSERGIVSVLKDRQVLSEGFHWRYGKSKVKADLEGRRKRANENRRKLVGVKLSQYTLKGKLVQVFNTIAEASNCVGVNASDINAVFSKKQRSAGGFIWRKDHGPSQIDLKGYITGEQYRAQRLCIQVGKFSAREKLIKAYSSLKDASVHEGCSDSYMSMIISQNRLYKGHLFKKLSKKSV